MQSKCYQLGQVFAAQLSALAVVQNATWADSPPLPIDMAKATRVLFLLVRGDRLEDQPGQQPERRRMRLIVGAVSVEAAGRAQADALHFAARDMLKSLSFRQQLLAADAGAQELRETDIEPELRDVASRGSVVMSAYELDYFQSYPSFAL